MVGVHDFGRAERERMLRLAIHEGWIQRMADMARGRGPTVVVVTENTPDGFAGVFSRHIADELWHNMPPRMREIQAAADCPQFLVVTQPLDFLERIVAADVAHQLRGYMSTHEHAVLCVNADNVALVCGVSANGTTEVDA